MLRLVVWWKFTDVSEMHTASIVGLIFEALSTSETSVNIYQRTQRNIPEDSHLRLHASRFTLVQQCLSISYILY
jgi:hypothetical protein